MKVFFILSIAATSAVFSNGVRAAVPDPSVSLDKCLAAANSTAESNRCYAIDNCNTNESANREQLRECLFQAEETYRAEAEGASFRPSGPAAAPTPPGVTSPVSTEVPDSDYSVRGGDAKGWKNATQGE